jgi:hypothetical protein
MIRPRLADRKTRPTSSPQLEQREDDPSARTARARPAMGEVIAQFIGA